jgi:hypothetical protein
MIFSNPEWLSAGASLAIAAETGVAVFGKSGKKASDKVPGTPAAPVRILSFDAVCWCPPGSCSSRQRC